MKICPACYQHLNPVDYEGFKVFQCSACKGHLMELTRLEGIKRTVGKSETELKSEAASDFKGSTDRILRCPRCHVAMDKRKLDLPVLNATIDVCDDCSLVWLDAGELALIQIAFEASPEFQNAEEMKRRVHDMESNPERKAAFEDNLAHLRDEVPDSDTDPYSPARHSIFSLILGSLFRI